MFLSSILWAQNPADIIDSRNVNIPFLEHLVKTEIDNVRFQLGLPKLINDSILFLAASQHADFLNEKRTLSHYQKNHPKKRTPQLRAEYYGAKNYQVGENLVQIQLVSSIKVNEQVYETKTYAEAAKAMMVLWINSPPHYANISTVNFDITGVAIAYNSNFNELRCVQMFAAINNLYQYEQNKNLFPYAENVPTNLLQNFEPIYGKPHKKHAYGIKENKKNKICSNARTAIFNVRTITLFIKNDSLYLGFRKKDLSKIKSYFKNKKDGISIEIVLFKYNYSCNVEDNYRIATRRNGRCEFDGYITKPLFKKAMLDSIQKTEKHLRANKIRLHRDEALFVNMGQFPPLAKGEKINANVIIYTKNRVCKVIEGVGVCGSSLKNNLPYIPIRAEFKAPTFKSGIPIKTVHFKVSFKQNSTEFDQSVIDEKIKELKRTNTVVIKAIMEAYASVEGTPEINDKLFRKRAELILERFEKYQNDSIHFKLTTTENWKMFYKQIRGTEYSFLLDWDTLAIREYINNPENVNRLEPFLAKQRYVYARLYLGPILNKETKIEFATTEFDYILTEANEELSTKSIKRLLEIQNFIFSEVANGNLSYDSIGIPDVNQPNLHYQKLLFDNLYANHKMNDNLFTFELKKLDDNKKFNPPGLTLNYYLASFNSGEFLEFKEEQKRLKAVLSFLKTNAFGTDTIVAFQRRIHHNSVNNYYRGNGGKYSNVLKSKKYLYHYFQENMNAYDDDYTFRIANYYTFMSEVQWSMPILEKLVHKPNYNHAHYQQYIINYYYLHSQYPEYDDYELQIIESTKKLTDAEWCNMFIGPCKISLPVFDNQAIKYLYCEKCR